PDAGLAGDQPRNRRCKDDPRHPPQPGPSRHHAARTSLVLGRAALSGPCRLDRAGGLAAQGPPEDYAALIAARGRRLLRKQVALDCAPKRAAEKGIAFSL